MVNIKCDNSEKDLSGLGHLQKCRGMDVAISENTYNLRHSHAKCWAFLAPVDSRRIEW